MVTAGSLEQRVGELTVTVGFGFTVNVPDPLPVQFVVVFVITTE